MAQGGQDDGQGGLRPRVDYKDLDDSSTKGRAPALFSQRKEQVGRQNKVGLAVCTSPSDRLVVRRSSSNRIKESFGPRHDQTIKAHSTTGTVA